MRHGAVDRIEQEKTTSFPNDGTHAHNTHSAIFAEVKVDEQLGVIRVTRVVSAVAAGRILNTKTARSQIMGGVVWGIGMALHEETLIDHSFGRIMNANIAEYHVPVNADVHDIKVIFVDEPDDDHQSARHQGAGRDRHRRRCGGDRQRGLSRDRQARARSADHAGQAAALGLSNLPPEIDLRMFIRAIHDRHARVAQRQQPFEEWVTILDYLHSFPSRAVETFHLKRIRSRSTIT